MYRKSSIAVFWLTAIALSAQEATFRSAIQVVNVDAIVRRPESKQFEQGLTAQDFTLKIDGKERKIEYFRKDNQDRRPLLLMVCFSLAPDGGLRELGSAAAVPSFLQALEQLQPEDRVAVYSVEDWFVGRPKLMAPSGTARAQSANALRQAVFEAQSRDLDAQKEDRREGARSMDAVVAEATALARQNPQHHVALVWISDGMNTLDMMEAKGRNRLLEQLDLGGVSFSSIQLPMLGSYSSAAAVLNPMGRLFGIRVTGSGKQLAAETGGIALDVPSAGQLATALGNIVSAYTSRYSLGFAWPNDPSEQNRWHRIEVSARTAGKVEISARKRFRITPEAH